MRKLSLFSGIAGIDLAAHWAGMKTVAFCEREPFPRRVLAHHWPGIPIYDDVCTLTLEVLIRDGIIGPDRAIDIISAGYPCQPFSHAGQRRGEEDDRHLWPEVIRLIRALRPRWFIGENVAGHITLGLDVVLADLAAEGYQVQVFVIPAAAVYGSHRRDRVFIVANTSSPGTGGKHGAASRQERESAQSLQSKVIRQRHREDGSEGIESSDSLLANTDGAEWWADNQQCGRMAGKDTIQEWAKGSGRFEQCNTAMGDATSQGLSEWGRSGWAEGDPETGRGTKSRLKRSGEDVANSRHEQSPKWSSTKEGNQLGSGGVSCSQSASCSSVEGVNRTTQPCMGGSPNELSSWLDGHTVNPLDALSELISSYPQPALMGMPQYDWEPPRVETGVKERTARLKALGNAVDPLQIYPVLAAIKMVDDHIQQQLF